MMQPKGQTQLAEQPSSSTRQPIDPNATSITRGQTQDVALN